MELAIILEFRIALSAIEAPKKILSSEVCFLCKANVSSEEKIKVFRKSTVAIHSFNSACNLKSICPFTSGAILPPFASLDIEYIRLLCYKKALDKVGEIENEIKQDFTNDGPFLKSQDKSHR